MDTVIFVPDLIEYAFVGISLSDAKFMRGEYSNESHNVIYWCLHLSNYWYFRHYLMPNKACLKLFYIWNDARRRYRSEHRERVVEDNFSTHTVLIYLECQKNTLSESEHILTLICAGHGRLSWSLWKLDVASVFFKLRVVSKSPAKMSRPNGAIL